MAAISSPIRVRTIQYGSPGFTDLVGLGALTKELREFLQFLILHFREREDRKLTREERRIQITRARLDLMEKLMEIRKSGSRDGLLERSASSSEFLELPKFDEIALAITEGRLTDVLEIDDDEKGKK
jgi:hypothetical protein